MGSRAMPTVRVPAQAKVGEIIEIRTLVLREADDPDAAPADGRSASFEASFNGRPFFRADWAATVCAPPLPPLLFLAKESGEFSFVWTDRTGAEQRRTSRLMVR